MHMYHEGISENSHFYLQENQIDALFMKIDWSSEGSITWDEFCTYMQLEYAEKEDSYLRAKEVVFQTPARIENIPHRDPILRITGTSDGTFIACSHVSTDFIKVKIIFLRQINLLKSESSFGALRCLLTDHPLGYLK